jgi:hypothetical protein
VFETTAHRLALHRVHVESMVRYLRREAFELSAQPDRGSEVTASARRRPTSRSNLVLKTDQLRVRAFSWTSGTPVYFGISEFPLDGEVKSAI